MGILDTKYAIVNADRTAFVYIDLGVPAESQVPKKSGLSNTHQGAIEIIKRMRAGCARNALKAQTFLDEQHKSFPGPEHAALRKSNSYASEVYIKRLEDLEKATYRVVELSFLELP